MQIVNYVNDFLAGLRSTLPVYVLFRVSTLLFYSTAIKAILRRRFDSRRVHQPSTPGIMAWCDAGSSGKAYITVFETDLGMRDRLFMSMDVCSRR
jgi:hypothetical protein